MENIKDVAFYEDTTLKKPRKCQLEETYEEDLAPRAAEATKEVASLHDDAIPEEHDMLDPQEPPHINISHNRNPSWVSEVI